MSASKLPNRRARRKNRAAVVGVRRHHDSVDVRYLESNVVDLTTKGLFVLALAINISFLDVGSHGLVSAVPLLMQFLHLALGKPLALDDRIQDAIMKRCPWRADFDA